MVLALIIGDESSVPPKVEDEVLNLRSAILGDRYLEKLFPDCIPTKEKELLFPEIVVLEEAVAVDDAVVAEPDAMVLEELSGLLDHVGKLPFGGDDDDNLEEEASSGDVNEDPTLEADEPPVLLGNNEPYDK